jgi:hypothetical protein
MRTDDLISRQPGSPAAIVRQLITSAAKVYVPEDVEKAVDNAISKFHQQMRDAARQELKFSKMQKISPKTGI